MKLSEIWIWYCEQRLGSLPKRGAAALSPDEVLQAFWTVHPHFTGRMDAIKAAPYSTDFDEEADGALSALAATDSFDTWDGLSVGAWRVLYERLAYCEVVVLANVAAGTEVIDHLPPGLNRQSTERALLLRYLLGHGRTIDRRLLPRSQPGKLPPFPVSATFRRQ